jgi:hypothetical protein
MSDLERRLRDELEPILGLPDPREKLSAYHDMPYALFRYDPEQEYPLRRELTMLRTRLLQKSKRVTRISLAECLYEAMASMRSMEEWYEAERSGTVEDTVQTITNNLPRSSKRTHERQACSAARRRRTSSLTHLSLRP